MKITEVDMLNSVDLLYSIVKPDPRHKRLAYSFIINKTKAKATKKRRAANKVAAKSKQRNRR